MNYRQIRYTVRTRIERNEWTVSIHPADIESPGRVVTGPRVRAELLARSMIDRWHERTAAKRGGTRRIAADIAKPRYAFQERTPVSRRLDDGKPSYSNTRTTSQAEITRPRR
jgi:hypothetical protein